MKRNNIILLSALLVLQGISACSSPQVTVTLPPPTAASASSETSSPTPTETPTPAPESLLPQEVKEKFEQAGIDLTDMTNAKYNKDGLHITLESDEVIVLTNAELEKNIYLGQDNVLQYRDEANQNVLYAFDKETQTFLESSRYIQKDKTDPEKYIQVKNWDELFALWAKEKMFLIPFNPKNTYFPPLDKIYREYDTPQNRVYFSGLDKEFNIARPFGIVPDDMDSPIKYVNHIRIQNTSGEVEGYIVSQQVFNPDDGSFSVLHAYTHAIQAINQNTNYILLPQLFLEDPSYHASKYLIDYYRKNNLLEPKGQIPVIVNLTNKWLDEGHIPAELENIPFYFVYKYTTK